uniref:CSON001822 protein n=1 Tax=Culicoides sonorensis TaxID=179676 RepID=A0A336LUB2_CULSO
MTYISEYAVDFIENIRNCYSHHRQLFNFEMSQLPCQIIAILNLLYIIELTFRFGFLESPQGTFY